MGSFKPFAVAAVLLYAVLGPAMTNEEHRTLDEEARKEAPGDFAALTDGLTHFRLYGPERGELVVLVHGFSFSQEVWGNLPRFLASKGYRVLAYDLFGRGCSDRPDVDYGPEVYDRQLLELLQRTGQHGPMHLVGLSMGGAIAVRFASRRPEVLSSVVLIDPAGIDANVPAAAALLRVPLVGRYVWSLLAGRTLRDGLARAVEDPALVPELSAEFTPQMSIEGYRRAILRTMWNMPLVGMDREYAELGSSNVPVLLVFGSRDRVVPPSVVPRIENLVPQTKTMMVSGVGHLPHRERERTVGARIRAFLEAHGDKGAPPPRAGRRGVG